MRKTVTLLTVALSLTFFGCDSENQSPNIKNLNDSNIQKEGTTKKVNLESWVTENIEILKTYDRASIATYSRKTQKAILRNFTPEKKKKIWASKMEYLSSSTGFSIEEKNYLKYFSDKLKTLSYDQPFSQELAQEMYNKVLEGINKFGWSNKQAYEMFFTIGNLSSDTVSQTSNTQLLRTPLTQEGDPAPCECYYDLGCPTWNCDSGNGCKQESYDCGVFGGTLCDGNC
ncbi:bacteriocin fulvocin C-related protein [Gaetbulibacter aestuarii]|uniref:Bacteriocin fulvocin C-related protein n=1 Tax=Gaetbulibacter aestuarii TaxID=1502358 RepID=A0ABW7N0H4_9FLAO